jgi:cytochrome c-type biogenesis protein CcmH/NrfF
MVQAGESDEDIKAALVRAYGKCILALPGGEAGVWLFTTPYVAAAAGFAFPGWLLIKLKRRPAPALAGVPPADLPAEWEDGWER